MKMKCEREREDVGEDGEWQNVFQMATVGDGTERK